MNYKLKKKKNKQTNKQTNKQIKVQVGIWILVRFIFGYFSRHFVYIYNNHTVRVLNMEGCSTFVVGSLKARGISLTAKGLTTINL
jgi:hypothetical protein